MRTAVRISGGRSHLPLMSGRWRRGSARLTIVKAMVRPARMLRTGAVAALVLRTRCPGHRSDGGGGIPPGGGLGQRRSRLWPSSRLADAFDAGRLPRAGARGARAPGHMRCAHRPGAPGPRNRPDQSAAAAGGGHREPICESGRRPAGLSDLRRPRRRHSERAVVFPRARRLGHRRPRRHPSRAAG